jgi:hypothetical protein
VNLLDSAEITSVCADIGYEREEFVNGEEFNRAADEFRYDGEEFDNRGILILNKDNYHPRYLMQVKDSLSKASYDVYRKQIHSERR